MKTLIKKYIDLLSKERVNTFLSDNNIYLNDKELNYIFDLIKNDWENIIVNEEIYINDIYNNINKISADKIKNLFIYYKNKYKDYLF